MLQRKSAGGQNLEGYVKNAKAGLTKVESKTLEGLLTGGASAVYGELLDNAQNTGMAKFNAEAWKGGRAAKNLAAANRWRAYTGKLNTALNRAAGTVNIAGNIYAGDTDEAAVSGVMMLLSELPNMPGGTAMMKYAGISGPVLSAGIMTFQIWRSSVKALAHETTGRHLQSLYGTMERICRDRNRKIGEGDPFPVNKENIDKVWRRLLTDRSFREAFRLYMTVKLKKDFPDTGWFTQAADRLYSMGSPSSVKQIQDQRLLSQFHEQRAKIESYIAGILKGLNRHWKMQEQGVIATKTARALIGDLVRASKSLETGLAKVAHAARQLDTVAAYAEKCGKKVNQAVDEKDFRTLMAVRKTIYDYVKDVVAWIPEGQPLGQEKKEVFKKLQAAYEAAGEGLIHIKKRLKEQIEKPESEPEVQKIPLTATMLYKNHMVPVIKEWPDFDWGWTESEEEMTADVKKHFEELFESGKKEAMEKSLEAWKSGAFRRAMEDLTGAKSGYASPAEEETINYYAYRLKAVKIASPPELSPHSGYSPEDKRKISRAWQEAYTMYYEAADIKAELLKQKSKELEEWMERVFSEYRELSKKIASRAVKIKNRFLTAYYSLAPGEAERKLKNYRATYKKIKYTGLPRYEDPPEDKSYISAARGYLLRRRFELSKLLEDVEDTIQEDIEKLETGLDKFNTAERDALADIPLIRRHYNEDFLTDNYMFINQKDKEISYADIRKRKSNTSGYISSLRGEGDNLSSTIEQDITNIDMALYWITRAEEDFTKFDEMRRSNFLIPAGGSSGRKFHEFGQEYDGNYTLLRGFNKEKDPYWFFLSKDFRNKALLKLKTFYETSYMGGFIKQSAPALQKKYGKFFNALGKAKTYPEENFFVRMDKQNFDYGSAEKKYITYRKSFGIVTFSGLSEAVKIVDSFTPGTDDFNSLLTKIQTKLPLGTFRNKKIWLDSFAAQNTPLGRRYIKLIEALNKKWTEDSRLKLEGNSEDKSRVENLSNDQNSKKEDPGINEIKNFYRKFQKAYESKDYIRVIGMLDDKWSSSEGTRLSEVEDHLRRMFKVFDNINYQISDLKISISDKSYTAEYNLKITGTIFHNNIKHKEKSSVTEELKKDKTGNFKIRRTLKGIFWTQ
ncbi:MAG: hypothetical protein ACQEQC_06120 [Elusimicrobiota bacterium]